MNKTLDFKLCYKNYKSKGGKELSLERYIRHITKLNKKYHFKDEKGIFKINSEIISEESVPTLSQKIKKKKLNEELVDLNINHGHKTFKDFNTKGTINKPMDIPYKDNLFLKNTTGNIYGSDNNYIDIDGYEKCGFFK